jgi:predicted thioesterase
MTAAYALMKAKNLESPPSTVTAELTVKFLKPTPIGSTVHLKARANKIEGTRVYVEGTVEANGIKTVLMNAVYVEVKEGHPGYGKWS